MVIIKEEIMTVVVTRHQALVEYLRELGLADDQTTILSHVTAEDVKGQDVIGVLPLSLASMTNTITEVPLKLTPEDRGQELSLERVREIAGTPQTYYVFRKEDFDESAKNYQLEVQMDGCAVPPSVHSCFKIRS